LPIEYAGVNIVRESLVKLAHELNLKVDVWTVNDAKSMKTLIDMGADGIITDRPDRLMSILIPAKPR
jgi:glycerophosphoryl diester phosphodiesterase